jgi:hypothetical protein
MYSSSRSVSTGKLTFFGAEPPSRRDPRAGPGSGCRIRKNADTGNGGGSYMHIGCLSKGFCFFFRRSHKEA